MTDQKSIILINTWKFPVSLYFYSRFLLALSDNIKIIDLTDDVIGHGVRKDVKTFLHSFTNINIIYKLNNINPNNHILHYVDPAIAPLSNKFENIVTLLDNPYSVLNTDLYMSSYLMKMHYRKNLQKFKSLRHIITATNYVKKSLYDYGFEGDITKIYIPVSKDFTYIADKIRLRKQLGLPLNKILILSIGVDIKRKNLGMVKSLSSKLDSRFKIVRIGKSLGNDISFLNIPHEIVNKIYNACDVLFMPSLEEGQGMPIGEAFTVKLPVVASDIPVFREVADKAAIFVQPNDINDVIKGINDAISTKNELIDRGFERSKLFTYEVFRSRMLQYYSQIFSSLDV